MDRDSTDGGRAPGWGAGAARSAASRSSALDLRGHQSKASDESSSAVPPTERVKELVLYSVSEPYFKLRKKLRITIDS